MTLRISESFYSIQGEGMSAGRPCFFLRLSNCNLLCGGVGTLQDRGLHNGATWRCDTIETWLKGGKHSYHEVIDLITAQPMLGEKRVVITGGEPLLQEDALGPLVSWLLTNKYKVEIETNGTIAPQTLYSANIQWNVSPKLANSGMECDARVKPEAMRYFSRLVTAQFKFVVSDRADVEEALRTFIVPFDIPSDAVWLMPASPTRSLFINASAQIADLAKGYGFNFSPRLQLVIWDQAVGV